MSAVKTVSGREIILGAALKNGRGGEGTVFAIANSPNEVAKIYHDRNVPAEKKRKLRHMVSLANASLTRHTAWPTDLVDGTSFAIVMPRASGHELHDVYGPKSRMLKLPHARFRFLVLVAHNLCAALHDIHAVGAIVGDFNQRNILVGEKAGVSFVDCDSFQITAGQEIFRCLVGTPDDLAPEAQGQDFHRLNRVANQDNFTLAVLIFQLLFLGRHPFAGVGGHDYELPEAIRRHLYAYGRTGAAAGIQPPDAAPKLDAVPPAIASLFERAFAPSANNGGRPNAGEWAKELRALHGNIVQCRTNASHEYNSARGSCPWCELYARHHLSFFLIDGQHVFRIDAATITELAERIIAAQPLTFAAQIPTPKPVAAGALPRGLGGKGAQFWFGFPVLAGAIAVLSTGHWFIAIAVGIWAFNLLSSDENKTKRTVHRTQLETAYRDAQKAQANAESRLTAVRDQYIRDFERQKSNVRGLLGEYRNLPAERQRRIENLNRRLKELQLEEFLDRKFIAHASISGIGAERKARLRAYGIETASDLSWQMRVPGFGPNLKSALMQWRTGQEQHFRFDPARKLDPREIQKVDAELLVRKQEIERQIGDMKNLLETSSRQAKANYEATSHDLAPAMTAVAAAKKNLDAFNSLYTE